MLYPLSAPIILTDVIYTTYGGNTGTSVVAQRTAAYYIAERAVSEDLDTFLLPIRVTGTYQFLPHRGAIQLDHAYVQSVDVIRFVDTKEYCFWAQTGTANVYVSLRSGDYGLVDCHYIIGNGVHGHTEPYPYQIQIIYTAGLPTGTANRPDMLLALVTYAQIILNEIVGYGNESAGDIGVQNFSDIQYREERVRLLRTTFGSSAKAQFISGLLTKYRKKRYVGL